MPCAGCTVTDRCIQVFRRLAANRTGGECAHSQWALHGSTHENRAAQARPATVPVPEDAQNQLICAWITGWLA